MKAASLALTFALALGLAPLPGVGWASHESKLMAPKSRREHGHAFGDGFGHRSRPLVHDGSRTFLTCHGCHRGPQPHFKSSFIHVAPAPQPVWVPGHWWWDGYQWVWLPGSWVFPGESLP